ncbi:MAG: hypothetical protein ACKVQR_01045 [Aquabacterium sp.]
MTMTTKDGFTMMKKPDRQNCAPKDRMCFWYGENQPFLMDKSKVAASDITKALSGKAPAKPFCHGRIGLYDAKGAGQELRVSVAGAVPSKLVKDIKKVAADFALRGVEVVIDEAAPEEPEQGVQALGEPVVSQPQPQPQPQPPVQAQPSGLNPQAALLLKQLKDMDAAYKQALASPVAAAKLKELKAKAAKHLQESNYDKAATDIANLQTLVQMALKHLNKPAPSSDNSQPTGRDEQQDFAEFAETLRQQKNTARAKRLGEALDAVKADKYFPVGKAEAYAKEGLKPGPEFKLFLKALGNFEQLFEDLRKGAHENSLAYDNLVLEMIGHTQVYLDHHKRDLSADQKQDKANQRKHQIASSTMKMLQQYKIKREFEALGPPDQWDLKKQTQAAALYSKVLFEEGDMPASPLDSGESGESGAWWVEALDFSDPKLKDKKKKFIFKPCDMEQTITGFPPGGSAPREVLSKVVSDQLQSMIGLNTGVPETALVKIDNAKLPQSDPTDSRTYDEQRLGSMQHFSKSDGGLGSLKNKDPGLLARIPKENVQSLAVLDLITLNCDRHENNFMVTGAKGDPKDPNAPPPQLVPIDHGLAVPSREGLNARRGRLGGNVLASLPASQEKMTPEMVAKIRKLDPDAVVKGMQESMQAMAELYPDQKLGEMVPPENLELTRRSIQFLQQAAAELTVDELFDAYQMGAEDIFDSPPEKQAEAFQRAISQAKARTAARRQLSDMEDQELASDDERKKKYNEAKHKGATEKELQAIKDDQPDFARLRQAVQGLGWMGGEPAKNFSEWCRRKPNEVLEIYKFKIENPALRRQLDRMLQELGQPEDLLKKIRHETLYDALGVVRAAAKAKGKLDEPNLVAPPANRLQAVLQEMRKELPPDRELQKSEELDYAAMWLEYQRLGGTKAYFRLGGKDSASLKARLGDLKMLVSLEESAEGLDRLDPAQRQEARRDAYARRLAAVLDDINELKPDAKPTRDLRMRYRELLPLVDEERFDELEKQLKALEADSERVVKAQPVQKEPAKV